MLSGFAQLCTCDYRSLCKPMRKLVIYFNHSANSSFQKTLSHFTFDFCCNCVYLSIISLGSICTGSRTLFLFVEQTWSDKLVDLWRKVKKREKRQSREGTGRGQRGRCAITSCSCMHPLQVCFCQSGEQRRSRAEQDAGYQMCGRGRWVRHYFTLPMPINTFTCLQILSGHVQLMAVRKAASGVRV